MKNEYLDVPAMRGSVRYRGRFTGNPVADFLLGYMADAQLSNVFVVDQRHWATSFFVGRRLAARPEADAEPRPPLRLHHPGARGRQPPDQLRPGGQRERLLRDGRLARGARAWSAPTRTTSRRASASSTGDRDVVLRGGYGIFYNIFDRIGSEDQLALNPPGLINNSLSTSSTTTPLFFLRGRLPRGLPRPLPDRLPAHPPARGRRGRVRRPPSSSSASASQKSFAGASSCLARPRRDRGAPPREPGQPQPAARAGSGALPYPDFGFIEWRRQDATSSYKGIDLGFQRRFAKGWGFSLAYTLSECTDQSAEHLSTGGSPSFPQDKDNLAAWEGPCGYDTRHRFVGSFVVELPFAKGSAGADEGRPRRLDGLRASTPTARADRSR